MLTDRYIRRPRGCLRIYARVVLITRNATQMPSKSNHPYSTSRQCSCWLGSKATLHALAPQRTFYFYFRPDSVGVGGYATHRKKYRPRRSNGRVFAFQETYAI